MKGGHIIDPDACFSDLLDAVADGDADEAYDHAGNLLNWLDRGGFTPGAGKLRDSAIREFCQWILARMD